MFPASDLSTQKLMICNVFLTLNAQVIIYFIYIALYITRISKCYREEKNNNLWKWKQLKQLLKITNKWLKRKKLALSLYLAVPHLPYLSLFTAGWDAFTSFTGPLIWAYLCGPVWPEWAPWSWGGRSTLPSPLQAPTHATEASQSGSARELLGGANKLPQVLARCSAAGPHLGPHQGLSGVLDEHDWPGLTDILILNIHHF